MTEIIHEALLAAAEEAFLIGARTSRNPVIYDNLDYSFGICDAKGRSVAEARSIPIFLGCLGDATSVILSKYGDDLHPGDVIANNDPYNGAGTHLNDVVMTAPIFHESTLIGFATTKGHWADIGGKDVGSWTTDSVDLFQEGFRIPCLKLFREGVANDDIIEMFCANSRFPQTTLGDMHSQLAAVRAAASRVQEIADRHGQDALLEAIEEVLDRSDQLVLRELAQLPAGVYEIEDLRDGVDTELDPVLAKCRVTVAADRFTLDFTGTGEAQARPANCTRTTLVSACRVVFQAIVGPQMEMNEGCWRRLDVVCPPNTIFTAEPPAPVSVYFEAADFAADLVWRVLAPIIPHRLPAGHYLTPCSTKITSKNVNTGESFVVNDTQAGGWGATDSRDGMDAMSAICDGDAYCNSCEVLESRYAILVTRMAFVPGSGGEGTHRGGLGVATEYQITHPDGASATVTMTRWKYPAWGVAGGQTGSPNLVEIVRSDGTIERRGPIANVHLNQGDILRCVSGGGGGWGPRDERTHELMDRDALEGKVVSTTSASEEVEG